jgi:nitrous oxidase accessory protein
MMLALWPLVALATDLVVGVDAPGVQAAVDLAVAGDTVVLGPGEWPGPVRITEAITLTSRGGVLVGDEGSTIVVEGPGVVVDHLTLRSSGDDLSGPDACIWVAPEGVGTVVVDSELTDCLFGIWLHEVRGARLERNHVVGRPDERAPTKGNGIHLFDSEQLVVADNLVEGARDGIYVSATEDSVIRGNQVSDQRYGIHYMFSYDNTIDANVADNNSGGIALMESRGLTVTDNIARNNLRQGILFRDVQYTRIEGNTVEGNGEGLFFFSSLDNEVIGNVIRGNQVGAKVWAGTERNVVRDNAFIANREQVFFMSNADQHWEPNYWSDYLGWDQDADGFGDRPYRTDAFLAQLLHRYPQAVLLLNSPTLEILSQLQRRLPALRVPTVVDDTPLVARPMLGGR